MVSSTYSQLYCVPQRSEPLFAQSWRSCVMVRSLHVVRVLSMASRVLPASVSLRNCSS